MTAAKYNNPPQAPLVFKTTPESVLTEFKTYIDRDKAVLDEIVTNVTTDNATFHNVLHPMLLEDNMGLASKTRLRIYAYLSADGTLREASTQGTAMREAYLIDSKMREDIFKLVEAAFQTRDDQNLDTEARHTIEKKRAQYVLHGLLLQGADRERFIQLQTRISALCIQAKKNLNEEKGGAWFTKDELEGVPEDDINVDELEKGTGENKGKFKVTFKYIHMNPLFKYAAREKTRREYAIGQANKLPENIPLFNEIIQLRDEAARLLGFSNHAEAQISVKMAKTPDRVNDFLADLRVRTSEQGRKEVEHLLTYKKKHCEARGAPFDGNLYTWDVGFYARMMEEQEYSVDEVAVSQYFPLDFTFAGMLKIFEKVLGFVFVKLQPADRARLSPTGKSEDITWHESVVMYSVWNDDAAGSGFIGYLYLDMHPRDNKYSHYANYGLTPGYDKADGTRNYPATVLMCNFSQPTGTKPALLKHHEVLKLFHELGHGIHYLAGKTRYAYNHGTSVARDFVEAPSQMLENWCWAPHILRSISQHWQTKQAIPEDLALRLMKTKHLNAAINIRSQIMIATFDMMVHSPTTNKITKTLDYGNLWNTLRRDICGIKGPEDVDNGNNGGNAHVSLGHLFGGYDAGYYGYLYSQVFSADMFHTKFKENPMDAEQGRRYRQLVLEKGGSNNELELLKDFVGREPNTEAFYQELGWN